MADDTAERDRLWEEWLADPERTDVVREVARKFPPWNLYLNRPTGQKAQIIAYAEDGTVRANCWHDWAPGIEALTAVEVFGLDPNDFEVVPTGDSNNG